MLIVSFIFLYILMYISLFFQVYLLEKKANFGLESFSFGSKPKIYQKVYKGIRFTINLIPFQLLSYDFKKYNHAVLERIQTLSFKVIPFFLLVGIHILCSSILAGFDFIILFYRGLVSAHLTEAEFEKFSAILNTFTLDSLSYFILSVTSAGVVYMYFINFIRNIFNSLLDWLEQRFNFSITPLFRYLIPTAFIFYIYLNGDFYFLTLIVNYTPTLGVAFDWIAGFAVLMLVSALVIEILSRLEVKQRD